MKLHCDNWMCDEFHKPVEVMNLRIKIVEGETAYFDKKTDEQFICEKCKEKLKDSTEFKGFCTCYGKFDSSTSEQKREILKKREKLYDKKNKSQKDYVKHLNNGGEQ